MFVQNDLDDHLDGLKRILLGGMIGTSISAMNNVFHALIDRYPNFWLFAPENSMKIDDLDRGRVKIEI